MRASLLLACLLLLPGFSLAAEPVDYLRDIKPMLSVKCYACHGALKQSSRLRVDTAELLTKGGRSGPALVSGKSAESLILRKVTAAEGETRMPPEGEGEALDAKQVALLRAWIDQGAKAPPEAIPPDPRQHWAYQLPVRPALPAVKSAGWVRNSIDTFIASEQERLGLTPVGPADKPVLLRRIYLDLVGLPPTREQMRAFLADTSDDAYEKVVDRLLASPHHGERWGRHWMDVWRYSDWSGYQNEIRYSQRHIWRWRDWILESLNRDKGYDRMIVEMLAGDELAPTDPDTLRATGFLARNWFKFNRNAWLDDTIEHTAKAFLAMTMNCARCHDHKFDPIAQKHYYQMRAIFEPHDVRTDRVPGELDVMKDGLPRICDMHLETPTYLFVRGNDKQPDKEHPLQPGLPDVLGGSLDVQPVNLPASAYYPDLEDTMVNSLLAAAQAAVKKAETDLATAEQTRDRVAALGLAQKQLTAAKAALAALTARVAADRARYANPPAAEANRLALTAGQVERENAVLQAELGVHRAEQALATAKAADKPEDKKTKDAVAKAEKDLEAVRKTLTTAQAALAKLDAKYTPVGKEYPRTSTGRRLALARWIADRGNPLTARVAVNHIWLRHFGAPLVDNVFDFGLRSERPRHAALLDWLAVEFMDSGWSMKKLHRLIVTSTAYRLDSAARQAVPVNLEKDPDNLYLWRMNSRRLEAEIVRDSILQVAGNLDPTSGGPEIDQNQGEKSLRRSVYFRHAYEKKVKFLELFDGPSENECYRRSESIVPQQALAISNSTLSLGQSRLLARRIGAETAKAAEPDVAFVTLAFEQVLSRKATSQELEQCRRFLTEQAKRLADPKSLTPFTDGPPADVKPSTDPELRARENLVHVLMNHNDFVTIR